MKNCHLFFTGLILGALTVIYAERYSRTTSRGRKIRREVNRTLRDLYGDARERIGRVKESVEDKVDEIADAAK